MNSHPDTHQLTHKKTDFDNIQRHPYYFPVLQASKQAGHHNQRVLFRVWSAGTPWQKIESWHKVLCYSDNVLWPPLQTKHQYSSQS